MIGMIYYYFGISSLLYMSCAAALLVQHVPNERNLQPVEYSMLNETYTNETQNVTLDMDDNVTAWESMERNRLKAILSTVSLSASCASETEDLIDTVADIFVFSSSSICSPINKTARTCTIEVYTIVNEFTCNISGGQFYDNYTEPNFSQCANIYNDYTLITDIGLLSYPICVGASCNASEVTLVLDRLILADVDYGQLDSHIAFICRSTSSVRNVFDYYGIVCLTFAIFAIVIYAF